MNNPRIYPGVKQKVINITPEELPNKNKNI